MSPYAALPRGSRLLAILLLGIVFVTRGFALEPDRQISQYGHTAWRVQDGSFSGAPTSIAQTQDGYIWIGTNSGLLRFDGVKFESFAAPKEEPLRNTSITALYSDKDGSLWIGTGSDLEHFHAGKLTHFPGERGVYLGVITKIFRSRDGVLWFARRRVHDSAGPVCSLMNETQQCFNANDGVEPWIVTGMLEDPDGSLWIHSDLSLFHWDPKGRRQLDRLLNVGEYAGLQQIAFDGHGGLLLAMAQSGDRIGLGVLQSGHLRPFMAGSLDGRQTSALAVFLDSNKSLWIGTDSNGLYRVNGSHVDHYGVSNGLSDDTVNGFFEDREGNIWVTTSQGIDRFRSTRTISYSLNEGLSSSSVGAVLAARDGTVWISNFRSLDALHPDGSVTSRHGGRGFPGQPTGSLTGDLPRSIPAGADFFPGQSVGSLMEDRKNRIWMGIDSGLEIFDGHTFTRLEKPGPKLTGQIPVMVEDQSGDVWAISVSPNPHGSLLHFEGDSLKEEVPYEKLHYDRGRALAADPSDGIWIYLTDDQVAHWTHNEIRELINLHRVGPRAPSLTALIARPDDFVIGSSPMGLSVIRHGEARTLSVEQGLPCANIYTLTDTDDALWLYSECGALEIAHVTLEQWWNNPASRPTVRIIDLLDGIRPAANAATLLTPEATHSKDGRLWFANSSLLQMLDPKRAPSPLVPLLPVLVEQIVADDKRYTPSQQVVLPPLTHEVEIDYTSPSFATPQRIHFRHKLDGIDDDWVDSGTRRQAFYTNLAPGLYRFRVGAASEDQEWTPDSVLLFRIPPRFYQTVWFTMLCVALALFALVMLFRLRLEAAKRNLRAQLQVRLDERERIARDLHDTLFQDIQGLLLSVDNSTNTLEEGSAARGALKDVLRRSDQVMSESRRRVLDLRSEDFDERSLSHELSQACIEMAKIYPMSHRITELGTPEALHPVVYEEVFHICREALLNAFRHSAADEIEVELLFGRDIFSVKVRDNGIGIDEGVLSDGGRRGHFGLKGITERAKTLGARLTIRSKVQVGTEVELSLAKSVATGARRVSTPWFGWLRGI